MLTLPVVETNGVDPATLGAILAVLYLIADWGIRIVLIPVVIRRHRIGEALAWLSLIFFQPFIGAAVYFVVGRNVLGRKRIAQHDEANRLVDTHEHRLNQREHAPDPDEIPQNRRDLVRLARSLGRMPLVRGNDAEFIADTQDFIKQLVEAIHSAKHHVHLLYYIMRQDESGERICEAVERAAQRGVHCRILLDGVGSRTALEVYGPRMRKAGAEVLATLPVKLLRRQFARIDVRNHRKLAIIDGHTAFTGSHNACDADYGKKTAGEWIDLTARLTGPIVYQLQLTFLEDWVTETGVVPNDPSMFITPKYTGNLPMQSVPSGPGDRSEAFHHIAVSAINEAEHTVVMTTPYLIPDEPSLLALKLRALAGIRTVIIVPEKPDQRLVAAAAKAYYEELLQAGVEIYLFQGGVLHAKTFTIDKSFVLFGSANFDRRSFRLNYELNLLMIGEPVVEALHAHQMSYKAQSRRLTLDQVEAVPHWRQLMYHTAKLFSPVL